MPRSSRGMTKKERRCRVHWALVTFVRVAGAGDAGQAGRSCMRAGTSPAPVAAGGADAEPKLTAVNFAGLAFFLPGDVACGRRFPFP